MFLSIGKLLRSLTGELTAERQEERGSATERELFDRKPPAATATKRSTSRGASMRSNTKFCGMGICPVN